MGTAGDDLPCRYNAQVTGKYAPRTVDGSDRRGVPRYTGRFTSLQTVAL